MFFFIGSRLRFIPEPCFCLIGEILYTNFVFMCQTWYASIQIVRLIDCILQTQFWFHKRNNLLLKYQQALCYCSHITLALNFLILPVQLLETHSVLIDRICFPFAATAADFLYLRNKIVSVWFSYYGSVNVTLLVWWKLKDYLSIELKLLEREIDFLSWEKQNCCKM